MKKSQRGDSQRGGQGRDNQRAHAGRSRRLFNAVHLRFRTSFLRHLYDAQELQLSEGDEVVVETSRGPCIALIISPVQRKRIEGEPPPRVLRKANEGDLRQAEQNESREREAQLFALERVRARNLPMKLIRAQYMQDGSKIVFFFSADGRIDFRDLVKDLAHKFRTRIEMHQIGVRDGARMLGGIGPCGRELCCSTFLENFAPVSIRMAKDQGLTLNPKKVSGMCGRLMCCLVYEQRLYKKMRRKMPRPNQQVFTAQGPARVIDLDVINERVTVELEDTNRVGLPLTEIALEEPREIVDDQIEASDDYLWGEDIPSLRSSASPSSASPPGDKDPSSDGEGSGSGSGGGNKRRQSKRRRARGANKGDSKDKGGEGGAKRKRRRRRGRRRKPDEGGDSKKD